MLPVRCTMVFTELSLTDRAPRRQPVQAAGPCLGIQAVYQLVHLKLPKNIATSIQAQLRSLA